MSTRRALLLAGGGLLAGGAAWPAAEQTALPVSSSLAQDLAAALAAGKALVVMVSLEGCPYCRIVRRSYLQPLRAAGQPVVQIEMGRSLPLADLRGRASTHGEVVRAWGARVAPTVLFLGRDGREAAPRLEGLLTEDFYGAYLQDRVEAANRTVG